jgi:hypothetical protein
VLDAGRFRLRLAVTDGGHLALAGDCSRRTLGWRVSTSRTTPLVTSTLEQALVTRRGGSAALAATGLSITARRLAGVEHGGLAAHPTSVTASSPVVVVAGVPAP